MKAKQLTGQAPDFELPDVKGQKIRLADFRGGTRAFGFLGILVRSLSKKEQGIEPTISGITGCGIRSDFCSLDSKKGSLVTGIEGRPGSVGAVD
ncbi:MAG: hypothetical protein V8R91_06680 [Butyricimonas faecihominis]